MSQLLTEVSEVVVEQSGETEEVVKQELKVYYTADIRRKWS